ncbi:hypothetical protein NK212_06140 [Elizabethkingia sp. S0634]|uniref:hypothetical protein n=1 Tax=Elizabethkingia sp. S0634 TaxID=2957806 RepID=UPI0020A0827A|nr:hypothetical protein [Elizabethkingia sp. S0634]MCP1251428.1 hypothetical protein [Elizabethkingia sp. S0634]
MTKRLISKSELYGTLLELQEKGAVFSLDIDHEIAYSFEDDWEGETIDFIIENAAPSNK